MAEFTIRDAQLADAGAMAEIIASGRERSYKHLVPGSWEFHSLVTDWRGASGAGIMHRYMQKQGEWRDLDGSVPRSRVAARVGDSAIVGVMNTRDVPVLGRPGVNLDHIFVDGATEGQGVGKMLMDDLTEYAGDRPQSLSVRADNERARGLYEKYGFEVVGAAGGFAVSGSVEMIRVPGQQ